MGTTRRRSRRDEATPNRHRGDGRRVPVGGGRRSRKRLGARASRREASARRWGAWPWWGFGGSARVEARGVGLRRPFAVGNGSPLGARARRCGSTIRNRERGSRGRGNGCIFSTHAGVSSAPGRPRLLGDFLLSRGGFGHETQKRLARFARSLGARRDVVTSPVARRPPPRARPADIGSRAPLAMSAPIPDFNPRSRARQHSRVDAVRLESRSPETAKKASRARRSIARGGAPCHPPGSRSRLVFSTHSPPRPRPARAARRASPSPAVVSRSRPSPRDVIPPPPPARAPPSPPSEQPAALVEPLRAHERRVRRARGPGAVPARFPLQEEPRDHRIVRPEREAREARRGRARLGCVRRALSR